MAGRAKENLPGGSLKYLFVYLKIRIFKCSYRIYIYMYDFRTLNMDEYGGTEKNATVYGLLLEEMVGGSMLQPFANFRSQVPF